MTAPLARQLERGATLSGLAQAIALLAFVGASVVASLAGGFFTSQGLGPWYDALAKPAWTPPGALIGAVWSVLFVMMAVAAWLVWRKGGLFANRLPLGLYAGQLVLNVAWSALFFGLRAPGAALVEIVVLEAVVVATLVTFWLVRPIAGALLVPYAAWVAFAGTLNFVIWWSN